MHGLLTAYKINLLMTFSKFFSAFIISGCLLAISLHSQLAHASSGGGGGGAGAAGAYIRIEPLTINLSGGEQYLQVGISIKGGTADAAGRVATYMPKIRHAMIMLLCDQKSEEILTPGGKAVLLEALKNAINKAIEMDAHDGITEVAYESFIVQ